MKFSYNGLVAKVDTYLRTKRSNSRLWKTLLPEKLFSPDLWLWEPTGVARGSAWGVFWALAPVPMQTIFAVLSSIGTKGNIPMSVVTCWISVPGYQVILWPLQWWVGAAILSAFNTGSGVDMDLIRAAAEAAPEGLSAMLLVLGQIDLWKLCAELLLGCLITCAFTGAVVYSIIRLIWSSR